MKKYTFTFTGRQVGAIGIVYKITDTYISNSVDEAISMLFSDYEHFRGLKMNGKYVEDIGSHLIDLPDYKRTTPRK